MKTLRQGIKTDMICQTLKAHRTTAENSPAASAWTDCDGLVLIDSESSGDALTLNADTKTIDIHKDGIYLFGGCVHVNNATAGLFTGISVLSRVLKNGTTEAKCSQREFTKNIAAGGRDVLSFNGTDYLEDGDSLVLQYYTDNANIDFINNPNFANNVAWSIWLTWCGNEVD